MTKNNDEHQADYEQARIAIIGADRMDLGLSCIPDPECGDMEKVRKLKEEVRDVINKLKNLRDKWIEQSRKSYKEYKENKKTHLRGYYNTSLVERIENLELLAEIHAIRKCARQLDSTLNDYCRMIIMEKKTN